MKKFMLVPPQSLPSPLTRKLSQLDEEMKTILDRQDLSEFDKARAYSETLDKYLDIKRRLQQPTPIPVVDQKPQEIPQSDKQVLNLKMIPQNYRNRAQNLLTHIEDQTDLNWNNKGELVVNGLPVIGSHIMDLVEDTVRSRPRGAAAIEPTGADVFQEGLRKSNVPQALIGNKTRFRRTETPERVKHPTSTQRKSRIDNQNRSVKWERLG